MRPRRKCRPITSRLVVRVVKQLPYRSRWRSALNRLSVQRPKLPHYVRFGSLFRKCGVGCRKRTTKHKCGVGGSGGAPALQRREVAIGVEGGGRCHVLRSVGQAVSRGNAVGDAGVCPLVRGLET